MKNQTDPQELTLGTCEIGSQVFLHIPAPCIRPFPAFVSSSAEDALSPPFPAVQTPAFLWAGSHAIAPWPPCPPGWWAPLGPVHIPQLPCLPVVTSAPHALSFQPCTSHSSPLTLLLAHPTLCVESKCLSYATSSFSRAETTFYPIVSPTKGRREGMPKSRCSKRKTRGMHATQVAAEITSDRGGKEWRGRM